MKRVVDPATIFSGHIVSDDPTGEGQRRLTTNDHAAADLRGLIANHRT